MKELNMLDMRAKKDKVLFWERLTEKVWKKK
jgi:hypothetical protein